MENGDAFKSHIQYMFGIASHNIEIYAHHNHLVIIPPIYAERGSELILEKNIQKKKRERHKNDTDQLNSNAKKKPKHRKPNK